MLGHIVSLTFFRTFRDADTPPNARVRYSLLPESDDRSGNDADALRTFTLNPESGELRLRRPLDREVREEYSLAVGATDGAWKLDTSVSVLVGDENDNAPNFDHDLYEFDIDRSQVCTTV